MNDEQDLLAVVASLRGALTMLSVLAGELTDSNAVWLAKSRKRRKRVRDDLAMIRARVERAFEVVLAKAQGALP